MSGQSLNDRLIAARHTIAGQGLARVVCKATTEEVIGPKKKHLDYLLHCTNEPNVSIPQLANLLIERTQSNNWVVVFKALVTVHHLMCYGNERFTQYLASSNCSFNLSTFVDKAGIQAGYDMSTFIRRYAKYLNEKAMSYRTVAFDFCKVKRGKEDGTLRTMPTEKLLKTVPVLQSQLDALLEFDCTANDLINGVINSCFMLLFRDLIRLFACYNDGIINCLEKYFDMNKKHCREALDIYKKFLIRMDRVAEFLKVAETVGIDKGDIPDLTKAPSSLLDALEQHLAALEGRKTTTTTTPSSRASNLKNAVTALSSTSTAFGTVGGTGHEVNGVKVDENVRKALEEEAAMMNQLKERHLKEQNSTGENAKSTNPFLSSPSEPQGDQSSKGIIDLFSSPPQSAVAPKASDDLLCLGNPFASTAEIQSPPQPAPASSVAPFSADGFGTTSAPTAASVAGGMFASDASFVAAFGNTSSGVETFGDVLQPKPAVGGTRLSDPKSATGTGSSLLTGDLDSTLANLAQNLDINGSKQAMMRKPGSHQWGSPKPAAKTGGTSWAPAGGIGVSPVAAGSGPTPVVPTGVSGAAWGSPQHNFQPAVGTAPLASQWAAGSIATGTFPGKVAVPNAPQGMVSQPVYPMSGVRPAAPVGMPVGGMYMPTVTGGGGAPSAQPPASSVNDPFGAL